MSSDLIEKKIILQAPLERVWQAIADSRQFGTWFGVDFDGPFIAGTTVSGRIRPTLVDPEIAQLQKPYEGKAFTFVVDRIEPMQTIEFRWHPFAVEAGLDYTSEPMTLIVFELEETMGGVLLTICESGFDSIPLERRAKAFAANDGGWTMQIELIKRYLMVGIAS
jgi:uncharacterized protein YndB with AHSA1/START domain